MRKLFAIALLFCAALACAQVSIGIRTTTTKARKAASGKSSVVATLHKGETYVVVDDVPYWYKITLRNGTEAFVRKSACTVVGADDLEPPPADAEEGKAPVSSTAASETIPNCMPTEIHPDWSICPADGDGGKYAEAYKQKSRTDISCSFEPITVQDMLALDKLPSAVRALPASDPRYKYLVANEARVVRLEGNLALVKDGGQEGVNCGSSTRLDSHMELVDPNDQSDPKTNRPTHVVVEVTPWFKAAIPGWSTEYLGKFAEYVQSYKNRSQSAPVRVRVYGHLFFDEAHASNAASWRGTAWEVHPITRIEILQDGEWKEVK